jgi:hypothetical protein
MSGEGVTVPKYSIPELTEMIDSVRQLGTVVTLTKAYPRWHQLLIKPKRGGRTLKKLEVSVVGARWEIEEVLKAVLLGAELVRRLPKQCATPGGSTKGVKW